MCQIWLRNCSLIALFVAGVRGAESASGIRPTEARQPPRALYPRCGCWCYRRLPSLNWYVMAWNGRFIQTWIGFFPC